MKREGAPASPGPRLLAGFSFLCGAGPDLMVLALKGGSDAGQEFFPGKRFFEEVGRADFLCSLPKAAFPAGGGEDDGDAPEVHALEILGNRKAIPEGHPDIHQDQIGFLGDSGRKAAKTIGTDGDVVAGCRKANGPRQGKVLVIFHDQDFFHKYMGFKGALKSSIFPSIYRANLGQVQSFNV
jgi:hypothetical protein